VDEEIELAGVPQVLRLSDQQRRLIDALDAKDALLGSLCRDGLDLLQREELPHHPVIVSHVFRELMDKLPRAFDVPVHSVQLREALRGLAESLQRAKNQSHSHTDDGWDGDIDDPLRDFLSEAGQLFDQAEVDLRSRREAARGLVRASEAGRPPMPQAIEQGVVDKWNELEVYFQGVSHHGRATDQRELEAKVGELESLLVGRLKVAVIEEYEEIDRLIEEGEAGA